LYDDEDSNNLAEEIRKNLAKVPVIHEEEQEPEPSTDITEQHSKSEPAESLEETKQDSTEETQQVAQPAIKKVYEELSTEDIKPLDPNAPLYFLFGSLACMVAHSLWTQYLVKNPIF
jgi:hypothetical protein